MKKFYFFLLCVTHLSFGQTVLLSENMGTPAGETDIAENSFENGDPIMFSGNADIRVTTPSTGYEGASGSGCVFLGATLVTQYFQVEGIDTSNYTDMVLSFGHYKTTNAGSNELTVEVSADGSSWEELAYTRPTGSGTSSWMLISPTGTIPSTENLRIRFTNPTNSSTPVSVGFRIDDMILTGTALGIRENTIAGLKLYPNPLTGDRLFIDSKANAEKTVIIHDIAGKELLNTKTTVNTVNVSGLDSGVYIVTITEQGKIETKKLVVR